MAAPTNAADAKKTLANQEPSTHGPKRRLRDVCYSAAVGAQADTNSRQSSPS
jgi:hypothetical protein